MTDRTNDACIRVALKARLEARHRDEEDVFVVEELPACRASGRIDLAVLNGHLEGFEIKSDLDALDRLKRQVATFAPAMEQMTLVVGERHLDAALDMVPDWWGVVAATLSRGRKVKFSTLQRAKRNRQLDNRAVTELLEKNEILAILRRHQADRGIRTASYASVVDRAISVLPIRLLLDEVREALKFRAAWEAAENITAFGRKAIILNAAHRPITGVPA